MTDSTPEELGKSIMDAQNIIHTVSAGWNLTAALAEFGNIMQSWAHHPKGRNGVLIMEINRFIEKINKLNEGKL